MFLEVSINIYILYIIVFRTFSLFTKLIKYLKIQFESSFSTVLFKKKLLDFYVTGSNPVASRSKSPPHGEFVGSEYFFFIFLGIAFH